MPSSRWSGANAPLFSTRAWVMSNGGQLLGALGAAGLASHIMCLTNQNQIITGRVGAVHVIVGRDLAKMAGAQLLGVILKADFHPPIKHKALALKFPVGKGLGIFNNATVELINVL